MTKSATPRCHFVNCKSPVTHTVQRLWTIPGRAPFALQHCCNAHIPGIKGLGVAAALNKYGESTTAFYRVMKIEEVANAS